MGAKKKAKTSKYLLKKEFYIACSQAYLLFEGHSLLVSYFCFSLHLYETGILLQKLFG